MRAAAVHGMNSILRSLERIRDASSQPPAHLPNGIGQCANLDDVWSVLQLQSIMPPKSKRKRILARSGSVLSNSGLTSRKQKLGDDVYSDCTRLTQLLTVTQLLNSVQHLVFLHLHSHAGNFVLF